MKNYLKVLYMPEGVEGGGAGAGAGVGAATGGAASGSAAGAGASGSAAGGAGAGAAAPFYDTITDLEIRENVKTMFPGMKSWEDLAKTSVNQQRLLGQNRVALPGKPEERTAWLQKNFNAPADAKGYKFDALKLPEAFKNDKTQFESIQQGLGKFAEHFAKVGMTQEQATPILEAYYEMAYSQMAEQAVARKQSADVAKVALQKEWGADYESKMNRAEMALSTLGSEDLVKAVMSSGLTDNVEFVRFLSNASELMREDRATGGMAPGGFAAGPQQAQAEIDQLYGDVEFMKIYKDTNHPGNAEARKRVERLFQIKHGEKGRKITT